MNTQLTVPNTPDPFEKIKALVLDALQSPHSRRAYGKALDDFLSWWFQNSPDGAVLNKAGVQRYARHLAEQGLAASTVNVRLTAVRRLAAEAADNGQLDPALASGIGRVRGLKSAGTRVGRWLTREEAEAIINAPNVATLKGKRDRALLAVLIGCGLRRAEVSDLQFQHVQQRDGRWVLVDLRGKGNRVRTVAMPPWSKVALDVWRAAAGLSEGSVFRAMNRHGQLTGGVLLPQNIMNAVAEYGETIGVKDLSPHDLRRTYAKLAHKGDAPLEQIQISLGHSSIQTTERYLGTQQDLQDAPCDHLGIRIK